MKSSDQASSKRSVVFNVRSFGAVGNGINDDSEAFRKAWAAACLSKTFATLLVPAKYSFMIQPTIFEGPCQSCLIFQIDGTLIAPDGPKAWKPKKDQLDWVVFMNIDGMSLQGSGLIDGRGQKWWNLHKRPDKAISFHSSSDLSIVGLRVKNSSKFHIVFNECTNVHVEWISIKAPADSPNTDGIHLEKTDNVKISNSFISCGDDCISIGTQSHNVEIRNVTCGPSHGISIGSLGRDKSRACVSNITVSDSIIRDSTNGVRIKTWQGGSGAVSRVTFQNIQMETVKNPIIINQYYCLYDKCPNQSSALSIYDVSYRNIRGTYDVRGPPAHIACSDSVPCRNVTLSGVHLRPAGGMSRPKPFCWKAYVSANASTLAPFNCLMKGLPKRLSVFDDDKSYKC